MRAWIVAALVLAVSLPQAARAQSEATDSFTVIGEVAVLQGLDKVTARISTIAAPLDEEVAFGTLRITPRACRTRPPTEPPEAAAFLEIDEDPPDGEPARIFSGWMFASSPALNALEHPVYDVWLLDCRTSSSAEGETSNGN